MKPNELMLLKSDNVFDNVEQMLQAEEFRPRERHYASSIVECPRRAWFKWKQIPTSHSITIAGYMKMRMGDLIGGMWARWLERTAEELHPGLDTTILDRIEQSCPLMMEDIEKAAGREERPFSYNKHVDLHTVTEIPFRTTIPGLKYEIGARIDVGYTGKRLPQLPRISEVKTSHSYRTRMIVDQGFIPTAFHSKQVRR